ncbi:hypothetical protein [Nonomuraea pusilla]|uniref:Uncharacterized protein n=1 Tax=Nonomuraea pusilla TaxID=46177 RepID=A0A1H7U724_9ACTN|nr:hypothetical protein [Nonomuraea pusilla]SEL92791.1 hypothetical protein SAMN05660976_03695 [Nonomuraea pusilla]
MTGSWRTPRRSIAFIGVMGLLLLAFLLVASSPAWYGSDPAHRSAAASGQSWALGASDAQLSGLPPQGGGAREHHVLSLWRPLRGDRHALAAHLPLLASPGLDPGGIRDPQQLGHRAAGSRSPPLI